MNTGIHNSLPSTRSGVLYGVTETVAGWCETLASTDATSFSASKVLASTDVTSFSPSKALASTDATNS